MKRGISSVLVVFLLIIIIVSAVALIWVVILPEIKLENWEIKPELSVLDKGYTAWDSEKQIACVQVQRSAESKDLIAMDIIFIVSGNSHKFRVPPPERTTEIPSINEARVYCFDFFSEGLGKPDFVSIVPVYSDASQGIAEFISFPAKNLVYVDNEKIYNYRDYKIFVSPDGSDYNDGSIESPVKTIGKAMELIADIKKINANKNINVYLKGLFLIKQAVVFNQDDSGTENYSVTYQSYPGESAKISGGEELTLIWEMYEPTKNIYKADVGSRNFRQLYVNGERAVRARTDEKLLLNYEKLRDSDGKYIYKNYGAGSQPELTGKLIVAESDAALIDSFDLSNLPEIYLRRKFAQHVLRISGISQVNPIDADPSKYSLLVLSEPENSIIKVFNARANPNSYYHFENQLSFLDQEGEWFLSSSGELYYKPKSGENINSLEFTIPVIEKLFLINNASNIVFKDIDFEYSSWERPSYSGYLGEQGGFYEKSTTTYWGDAYHPPSALKITNSRNIYFYNCNFRHFGGMGIAISNGTDNIQIINSKIEDVSGNGIAIPDYSDFNSRTSVKNPPKNIIISNSRILKTGGDFYGSYSVGMPIVKNMSFEHNEVAYNPYTGIAMEAWGGKNSTTGKISFNNIHNVMEQLSDGGAIYSRGNSYWREISYNYIHDVLISPYSETSAAHAGIYMDDCTSGNNVTNNVIIPQCASSSCAYWGYHGSGKASCGNYYNILSGAYTTAHGHEDIVNNAGPK